MGGSRFVKQWTAVVLGMSALGLASLLLILPRYRMQQQAISMAKEAVIRNNMRALHTALAQYMAEDGRGYPTSFEAEDDTGMGRQLQYLSHTVRRLQNPFDARMPAVAVSRKDPPFWNLYKPGQVVYVPVGAEDGLASGYVIYGLGSNGPLGTVIDCRPENDDRDPKEPDPDYGP
jgi:type II secretory pathway pseudopilin PulG